jgi:hypothetical protein
MEGILDSPNPKKFPLPLRMMGRNFCFWPCCDSPQKDNDFLPVKRLGWRFRFIEFLTGLGRLDPSLQRHHASGGGVGNAHEAGSRCEIVLLAFISKRFGHECHQTFRADQKQGGRQVTNVPHGVVGVMLRLRQKVIQIFESVRLHSLDFDGNREGGQDGFWAKISMIDSKPPAGLPMFHDQSGCLPPKLRALHAACQSNEKT